MTEPPKITYKCRPQIGDMIPACGRCGDALESIGIDGYGEGLYCPECMWWWPGLDYWPDEFQCHACEGTPGRQMPYDALVSLMRADIEETDA